jgi:hypothetical protein
VAKITSVLMVIVFTWATSCMLRLPAAAAPVVKLYHPVHHRLGCSNYWFNHSDVEVLDH